MFALLGAGCGAAGASPAINAPHIAIEKIRVPSPTTTISRTTTTTIATTTTVPDPYRTLIATARLDTDSLVAYIKPGGPLVDLPFIVPNPHQFGGPLTLMITEGSRDDDWVKVQLPIRPNGQEGWIRTADYILSETRIRAEVNLAETTVKVFDGEELIAESSAAIGTPQTPTPLGTFFVAAIRENPPEESFLGTHAVVLSAYSEVLTTFSGGLPVIAVHGSNNPDRVLGRAISNGCVRVPNDVIAFLAKYMTLGAPVTISA